MRIASICAVSALALGFVHSPALAQNPPPTPQPTISEREEVRNTYIFKFADSVSREEMPERARQAVAGTGGTLLHVYTNVLGGFAATLPSTALWNVARRPGIVSFERDQIYTIVEKPDGVGAAKPEGVGGGDDGGGSGGNTTIADCTVASSSEVPWGVERINALGAHGATDPNCGHGIDVYVIDTGIDLDHPDLTPVDGVDCTSGCVSGGDDKNGHGTHVAGTIAARINGKDVVGVAPAVHLHGVQVLGPSGMGSMADVIAGVDYVAGQSDPNGLKKLGPVVANLSLGGSGGKAGTCSVDPDVKFVPKDSSSPRGLHQAMCEAAHKGVVFVVAAGNSDADAENYNPAAYDDAVITVTATDSSNDWRYWSNYGDGTEKPVAAPAPAPVAVAAPGVSIKSTKKGGGTTTMSGTSMASPHVAGVASLLLKKKIDTGTGYLATYDAFDNIRKDILVIATPTVDEETGARLEPFKNNSGNPHDERFACAVTGC